MEIEYANKYMKHRKENVLALRTLLEKRKQITKDIKLIESTLNGWDNSLITYGENK